MVIIPLANTPLQYMDLNGDPMTGGTLEFYRAGTTTPTPLYNSDGTSIGTSIALNSRGMPESGGSVITLFRNPALAIKVVLKNASGATIATSDNIPTTASFDSTSADKLGTVAENADVTNAATVGAVVNGRQSLWVPASAMYPVTTNGCAALAVTEITAGKPNLQALAFDAASKELAQFAIAFPKRWNSGTITFQPFWTHGGGNTAGQDGVCWSLKGVSFAPDDSLDALFGNAVSVGLDAAQSANDLWVSAESAGVTIGGEPQPDEMCIFEIAREVDSSSPLDDLDVDAKLLGIKLFWTSAALNDA